MRVLHFIDSEGVYGAERVILNLSAAMLGDDRWEPVVGCIVTRSDGQNPLYRAARKAGIEAHEIVVRNAILPIETWRLTRRCERLGIDLIHAHGYKTAVLGYFARSFSGVQVLSTCHLWFEPQKGPLKQRFMVGLEKRLYPRFPHVVGVSDAIREEVLSHGVDPSIVSVVPNGVPVPDPAQASSDRHRVRAELGLRDEDFVVTNVGRLTGQKAQWSVVDAAAELAASGRQVVVFFLGKGPLENDLRRRIDEKGVAGVVRMLGFRDDIGAVLAASDAFLLPSLDEGMPMALLEAVAVRLPVIASAVGDVPKLVEHEVSGLIVPPADAQACARAVERLMAEPGLGEALATRALTNLRQKYTVEAMYDAYAAIYADLLEGRPTRRVSAA